MDRVRVFMFWPGHSPDNYYRIWLPANYCGRELHPHGIDIHWGPTLPWGEPYDCYWVHGIQEDSVVAYLEARRDAGSRIVWDLDDDYWSFPRCEEEQWKWIEERLPAQEVLRDLADLLVVSTPRLAHALPLPKKTIVCPNLVEPFDPAMPARYGGPVRVLVAGSYVHDKTIDAMLTQPILRLSRELRGQAEFIFLGGCPDRLRSFVTVLDRVLFDDYWQTLQDIGPDIWLVPMISDAYMDCKTPLKWLEGTQVGAAVIASDVPAYRMIRHNVDGKLATNWEEEICNLLSHQDRAPLCAVARERLLAEYSWISPARGLWLEAFRRALA